MLSIIEYLRRGPSTSKEIQAATNQSQSTVSRQVKSAGDSIVQIQEGRSVKYAATCNAFGANDKIPLGMINPEGECIKIAIVRPLNCGSFFIEPIIDNFPSVLLGDAGTGLFEDLPYFLYDMRAQGFIGRQIAKKIATKSDEFPSNPNVWTTDQIGRYLISNGEDLPGNLIFGEPNLMRIRQKPLPISANDYPGYAENVLKGEPPGSSAGGEQPKFTAFSQELKAHVIVKFSPKGENEVAIRWKDILLTEYHASRVLSVHGYPAVEPNVYDLEGRLFLEFERFDRIGEFGRTSMLSLDVLDREFVGRGSDWRMVVEGLYHRDIVDEQTLYKVEALQQFGVLINNNDMHLGNLSFSIQNENLCLLPIYDMCSMGFVPKSGEVLPFEFFTLQEDISQEVFKMVYDFWSALSKEDRLSIQFRDFAGQNLNQLRDAEHLKARI